ncbi:MAG TPA: DUF1634 domain-containing protein [Acidimicrobiales bacterium]|nr:DUF1634 domain-containing protein [Acidimicrobiales bacterium]
MFAHHRPYLPISGRFSHRNLTSPATPFPHSFTSLGRSIARGDGRGVVVLGVLILIATHVLRVAVGVLSSLYQGDRPMAAVTMYVLVLLVGSFFLAGFVRERGRGTTVAPTVLEQPLHSLYSLASTLRASGLAERSEVLASHRLVATGEVAARFGAAKGTESSTSSGFVSPGPSRSRGTGPGYPPTTPRDCWRPTSRPGASMSCWPPAGYA